MTIAYLHENAKNCESQSLVHGIADVAVRAAVMDKMHLTHNSENTLNRVRS